MRIAIVLSIFCLLGCEQHQNVGNNNDHGTVTDLAGGPADLGASDLAPAPDPCLGVSCTTPPASSCVDPSTLRAYVSSGSCSAGQCNYTHNDTHCPNGCQAGACTPDPCGAVLCDSPPPNTCADAMTQRRYATPGLCTGGACTYTPNDFPCDTPPLDTCLDDQTVVHYSASGSCSNGNCSYPASSMSCAYGCVFGQCNDKPKRLFVTRGTFDANFGPHPDGDALCKNAAAAASLGGSWKAWLADPGLTNAPAFKDVGPWFAMDGTTKLFNNPAALGGFPLAPITLDEYGAAVGAGDTVWTGLTVGLRSAATCYTWDCLEGCSPANTGYKGTYGQVGTTAQAWTNAGSGDCYVARHLYCLEQ
jgi:hypothetical protein